MRPNPLAAALVALTLAALPAARAEAAPGRPFGLGIVVGEPTGLTAKLYLNQPFALQFGAGFIDTFNGNDGFHLNFDFIWHPAVVARDAAFTMPFYLGVGGRFWDRGYDYYYQGIHYVDHDSAFGVRVPFGLLMDFTRVPLDLYFELALVVDLVYFDKTYGPYHDFSRVGWNGGIGLRYYF
jgi:hypothetical protein